MFIKCKISINVLWWSMHIESIVVIYSVIRICLYTFIVCFFPYFAKFISPKVQLVLQCDLYMNSIYNRDCIFRNSPNITVIYKRSCYYSVFSFLGIFLRQSNLFVIINTMTGILIVPSNVVTLPVLL